MGQWMMLVLSRRYSTLPALASLTAWAMLGVTVPAFGAGHQALGAEQLTETADDAHHVGGGDDGVELEPVLALDLLDQLLAAGVVGASRLGLFLALGLAEDEHADALAGAVGQHDGAADLLVGVTGVDAELDVQLDGLVELGAAGLANELKGLLRDRTAPAYL